MSEKNKTLVIVESPAKAKTIEKFLGSDYIVKSSVGHIRDLPKKGMSIDIENNFTPLYEINEDKKKVVSELKKIVKTSDKILLATDEDREGEAIAWHLYETLALKKKETKRIVFHEITKNAILKAINNPRDLNKELIDAQQARRVLDRLVGYELSPVLWKKVKTGLSAGRVQSVSVRLIVEREREIENFNNESSYRVTAEFTLPNGKTFSAELKRKIPTYREAKEFVESLRNADFKVENIEKKPAKKKPAAPFTTSTLQQEASRKLGFSVKQTMTIAQKLYENGKITYMRTDSLNLSETAIEQAKQEITANYGEKYSSPTRYKTKSDSAQEAHEAIRPTDLALDSIKGDKGAQRLYELIWKRTIASQMSDALLERTIATIAISGHTDKFEARGEVIKFDGFLKVYIEDTDDDSDDNSDNKLLPAIEKNDNLKLNICKARESFKRPPARYTEASLVKKLEELGIGRPSTYAPTISTIQDRGYVVKEDRDGEERKYKLITLKNNNILDEILSEITGSERSKLFPTDIGSVVNDFLVKFFPEIVDFQFTAKVEEEFDEIANGKKVWNKMIAEFYEPFHKTIEASGDISRKDATQSRNLGDDPKSGKPIFARIGRYGPMLQLGETEDDDKPIFAPIPQGVKFDKITLEEALPFFNLPHEVGVSPDGYKVITQIGRFGPYIRCNKTFVSIQADELFSITLEDALQRVKEKEETKSKMELKTFEGSDIKILNGRFGPYITDGTKNVKIPKGKTPESLELDECIKLIDEAPDKKKKTTSRAKKK